MRARFLLHRHVSRLTYSVLTHAAVLMKVSERHARASSIMGNSAKPYGAGNGAHFKNYLTILSWWSVAFLKSLVYIYFFQFIIMFFLSEPQMVKYYVIMVETQVQAYMK